MRFFKLFTCLVFILGFCLFPITSCFAENTVYVWSPTESNTTALNTTAVNTTTTNTTTDNTIADNENKVIETNSENEEVEEENSTNENTLSLESGSAILIEQTTGQILYEHNIHEQLRPASVTKIMSILLIMEALDSGKINLTDTVPCSENAASMGGSQIWLDPRETLTVDEMLKAICVNSANDYKVQLRHKKF